MFEDGVYLVLEFPIVCMIISNHLILTIYVDLISSQFEEQSPVSLLKKVKFVRPRLDTRISSPRVAGLDSTGFLVFCLLDFRHFYGVFGRQVEALGFVD